MLDTSVALNIDDDDEHERRAGIHWGMRMTGLMGKGL